MKIIMLLLTFLVLGISGTVSAQQQQNVQTQEQETRDSIYNAQNPVVQQHNRMSDVIQSTGKTYNSMDLNRMATRDLNKIVNTVPGVQYQLGETPIIRGAIGGTAFFVDGMRVYGTMPILTR